MVRAPVTVREPHILLVVQDQNIRYALADSLLDAGFRLTLASTAGVGNALGDGEIDLVVSAHPIRELSDVSLTRRARAAHPQVPILLVEEQTANGPGVLDMVRRLIQRWPVTRAQAA